jgi:hypothetical protein
MNLDWTYEEFSAFAMLYAASIDAEIDPEEEALIRQRLDERSYRRVRAVYEECSDSECINTILGYQKKFMADEAGRERLLSDLREVFEADHRYTAVEREIMHLFKRLLESDDH